MSSQAFGILLFGLIAQNLLFVGVTLWWLRRSGRTWKSIGLACPTRQQVLLAVGYGLALAFVGYWLGEWEVWLLQRAISPDAFHRLQRYTETYGAEHAFQQLPAWWMMAGFALVGSVVAPIGEEMLFRGLIFHALQERLRSETSVSIALSALLFALVHGSPLALLPLFVMGVAFAVAYIRTGSLWVPIGMHAINNAAGFLLLTRHV